MTVSEQTSTTIVLSGELTRDFAATITREWIVTNGTGGYAMGTISGAGARVYHGYLVAATRPPVGRTLLVEHLDETAAVGSRSYDLGCNEWHDETVWPTGYRYLERFFLDGTLPVWHYRVEGMLLEKRVWMVHGQNTTTITYRLLEGSVLDLHVAVAANERDHHAVSAADAGGWHVEPVAGGLGVRREGGAVPWLLLTNGTFVPEGRWETGLHLRIEAERGLAQTEARYHLGTITRTLTPDEPLTLICSTEASGAVERDAVRSLAAARRREQELMQRAGLAQEPPAVQQLVLAADQFIVARPLPAQADARTVIAGYPWFGDWGRDTMIALPGLCLATGRPADAAAILRTFARFVSQGMLPNRFPDQGEQPEYNTVDATLWYVHAIDRYLHVTSDEALLVELLPALREIIAWHLRGTRYGIGVDPADGLLRAGEAGAQLTWMDVRIGDWVVTPRHGKAVEINTLWYVALQCMSRWSPVGPDGDPDYAALAARVKASFGRFWYGSGGYLYDVIDTPAGDDATLRPNQVIALALAPELLSLDQRRAALSTVTDRLLTPVGLRTLDPRHRDYHPRFTGNGYDRDSAYHQGTVWPWLIGHYADALRNAGLGVDRHVLLQTLLDQLWEGGMGSLAEVYDGDVPRHPAGCMAQAWSIAELLRAWTRQ